LEKGLDHSVVRLHSSSVFQTTPSKYLWFLILFCRVHCDMPPLLPPSATAYVPAPPRPRPGTVLIVAESRHTTRFARMSWASLVTSSLREPELASLALFPVRSLWTFLGPWLPDVLHPTDFHFPNNKRLSASAISLEPEPEANFLRVLD
jgi:hypothetical protein